MIGPLIPLAQTRKLTDPTLPSGIWQTIWAFRRLRALLILTVSSFLALTILYLTGFTTPVDPHLQQTPPTAIVPPPPPKEAYVLFFPTSGMDQNYLKSALIMIFALTTDPHFKDQAGRDIVVLTSHLTSDEDIATLQKAGAKTHPIPYFIDGLFPDVSETLQRYKYTFNKIWIWDLVQYDRVLFMDADMVFVRPLADVWIDPHAWPKSGLAATADVAAVPDGSYFNSGFLMVRPDRQVLEELKKVELDDVFYPDQNLLNKYFRQGSKPWEPLNHRFQALHPSGQDIADGAYTLQEKGWLMETDPAVGNVWWEWYGRMLGWQEVQKKAEERLEAEVVAVAMKNAQSWWRW